MKRIILPLLFFCIYACNADKVSLINQDASIEMTDAFPENPLLEKVFTSSINIKDSSMSTLYGNRQAWDYAIAQRDAHYPAGAVLYQVTWKQQPDPVWFGADIPGAIKFVERVVYINDHEPVYELYEGNPLKKSRSVVDSSRLAFITAQRPAVSP